MYVTLILAHTARYSGIGGDDDYVVVLEGGRTGRVIGRIMLHPRAPKARP